MVTTGRRGRRRAAAAEQLAGEGARLLLARVVAAEHVGDAEAELAALSDRAEVRAVTGHSPERGLAALARGGRGSDRRGSDRRTGDYRAHTVLGLRLLRGAPCAVAIASADGEQEIRRIGVAYDGSAEAELALDAAYAIAQRLRAAVTLYLAVLPEYTEDLRAQLAHREAGALLDAAAERAPAGVNPETLVVTGYASLALAERAAGVIDLLVIGSRRQGPIRQALLGSTSRALTVELDCAVLVTPGVQPRRRGRADPRWTIVVPCAGSAATRAARPSGRGSADGRVSPAPRGSRRDAADSPGCRSPRASRRGEAVSGCASRSCHFLLGIGQQLLQPALAPARDDQERGRRRCRRGRETLPNSRAPSGP